MHKDVVADLLAQVRACRHCVPTLPLGPRPVFQLAPEARILIAAQAPGRRVHETGIPFNDPSGDRLRKWLGVDRDTFYDPACFALLPMAFCYPGTGPAGDFPPPRDCARLWRDSLLAVLPQVELTIVVGKYALAYHLPGSTTLTETVWQWRSYGPAYVPLPHPSPRNNRWLARHPWFEAEVIPSLQAQVAQILARI